jgi:hypothetical protein
MARATAGPSTSLRKTLVFGWMGMSLEGRAVVLRTIPTSQNRDMGHPILSEEGDHRDVVMVDAGDSTVPDGFNVVIYCASGVGMSARATAGSSTALRMTGFLVTRLFGRGDPTAGGSPKVLCPTLCGETAKDGAPGHSS